MHQPSSLSVEYLEGLLEQYLEDPDQVPLAWRDYFADLAIEPGNGTAVRQGPTFRPAGLFNPPAAPQSLPGPREAEVARVQDGIQLLLRAYRERGHLGAQFNPLEPPQTRHTELTPEFHGLSVSDLDRPIARLLDFPHPAATLRELLDRLERTYCRSVGVEFMHIDDLDVRQWLLQRMESTENTLELSPQEQVRIFSRLTDSVVFEEFVQRKYVGAKTFSLEGAEIVVPLLDRAIEKAAGLGIDQIVMGMAHRGRLNVLANILGKAPRQIFHEFEDRDTELRRGGDVKYHLGHTNLWHGADGRRVRLTLCFNPSHLEFVNPVAEGVMRAKLDRRAVPPERGLCLLIHGDAAFAGEGVVQETLNLSRLPGYYIGGTVHVIVNNQIGFTTSPGEARSGRYATDVAKMLQSPIFHVNGEDAAAVAHVINLAIDFRQRFQRDVFVDVYCYRRRGHNESDEPSFTQPVLYRRIAERKSVRDKLREELIAGGVLTPAQADHTADAARAKLETEHDKAKRGDVHGPSCMLDDVWKGYRGGREVAEPKVDTSVDRPRMVEVLRGLAAVPNGFRMHPKLERILDRRREMADGQKPLDWAAAEAAALATLAIDGYRVRLSGQDAERGTFSHRHAVLHDYQSGNKYVPLAHVAEDQAPVELINSPLSEAGPLGFEYGYSLDYPDCLVVWEAQFGDFWNVGQVIVDQFLASAEEKWSRLSGIVLLLPHGYEGQGPEHSSARLERFLNLATEHNLQVVQPTTPAQIFHVLRRWLKPLVVLAPKSLLRHPRVVSDLDEFTAGSFHRVIPDRLGDGRNPVSRVLLCSGKIYYELLETREKTGRKDVAIVRLEQLYPFPQDRLRQALDVYREGTPVYWVQEEPENMGACYYLKVRFREELFDRYPFRTISRRPSASPATGSASVHAREQREVVTQAFGQVAAAEVEEAAAVVGSTNRGNIVSD